MSEPSSEKPTRQSAIALLESKLPDVEAVLPPGTVSAQKLEVAFRNAFNRDPELAACAPLSICNALVNCASLGIVPNTPEQHAYLIARRLNKGDRLKSCCLEISYRGFVHLMVRGGLISKVESGVIHEGDEYELQAGEPTICRVRPNVADPDRSSRPILCSYALIVFRDGTQKLEVMGAEDLRKIEQAMLRQNFGKASPAWREWRTEMLRKAPIKRIAKTSDLGALVAAAADLDNQTIRLEAAEPRKVVLPDGGEILPLPRGSVETVEDTPARDEVGAEASDDLTPGEEVHW